MTTGQAKLHLFFGSLVFLFLIIIGLASDVSLGACLYRASIGGVVFGIVTFSVHNILRLTVFYQPEQSQDKDYSANFDYRIDDDGVSELNLPENVIKEQEIERVGNNKGMANVSNLDFQPLKARQVDPELNRKINEDPERAAELIRKMGLDEE